MFRSISAGEKSISSIASVLQGAMTGKINATKQSVTLTANVATTTLSDIRIGPDSVITFMPTTANAATDLANLYVTGKGDGTCTLNHTNNAQADRTYDISIIG